MLHCSVRVKVRFLLGWEEDFSVIFLALPGKALWGRRVEAPGCTGGG